MIFGIFLQKTITATIFYGKSADSLIMVSQLLYIKGAPPSLYTKYLLVITGLQ